MIYDCFPFFNELDLLEIRLNTHDEFVDKFIIIEANQTHSGYEKPLFLNKNWDRFKKFHSKIIYHSISFPDDIEKFNQISGGPKAIDWKRENYQREYIKTVLKDLNALDNDIIISSDCDEIIDSNVFSEATKNLETHNTIKVKQNHYAYKLNYFCGMDTDGVVISNYKNIKSNNLINLRLYLNESNCKLITGGWHFSFLSKDDENVYIKFKSFAHAYENSDVTDKNIAVQKVKNHLIKSVVEIDNSYPKYIIENIEKYNNYIGD